MASEKPQEVVSEPLSDRILMKQHIRLAQPSTSTSLDDMPTIRQQYAAALLRSIHRSRDQYQSFSDVEELILPTPPVCINRWYLLKKKMETLLTLKSSLEKACNADSDLQQSTKQFLLDVTTRDVNARISKDSTDLEAARAQNMEWDRSEHSIDNKYKRLLLDIPVLIATNEGRPRAIKKLIILYWIAVAVITVRFKDPQQQTDAVELEMKRDFDVRMFDLFLTFSGAMLAVGLSTSVQLHELGRRYRDHFFAPDWKSCVFLTAMHWIIGSMAYMVFRESERPTK